MSLWQYIIGSLLAGIVIAVVGVIVMAICIVRAHDKLFNGDWD